MFDLTTRRTLDREAIGKGVDFMERHTKAAKPFSTTGEKNGIRVEVVTVQGNDVPQLLTAVVYQMLPDCARVCELVDPPELAAAT